MRVTESRRDPNRLARELFDGLPRRYDRLAELLSFGQNRRWRQAMIDAVTASPGPFLDVACGTAGVALQLAATTGSAVVGIDLTPEMVRVGASKCAHDPAGRSVRLVIGRAEDLPFPDEAFGGLTFTYLLRYVADPAATLRELARVVRPGGIVASLEFGVPTGAWRWPWVAYTRAVLPVAGFVTGGREWFNVGRFLGPSISAHYHRYPLAWHADAWRGAGITDIRVRPMSLGGGVVMWGRRG